MTTDRKEFQYRHTYRIERSFFESIAWAKGWELVERERKSGPPLVIAVCSPPPWKRSWTIAECEVGNYSLVTECFHTNLAPKFTDPRVQQWR